jgi:hypothetical protein
LSTRNVLDAMGTAGLDRAAARGAPLADVEVRFRAGVDAAQATRRINALADDLDLYPGDWHGNPLLRIGSATAEALERLFGWRLARVPLERYDEASGTWGTWENAFRWEEIVRPQRYPDGIEELIDSIGITQPGADDQGQPWP